MGDDLLTDLRQTFHVFVIVRTESASGCRVHLVQRRGHDFQNDRHLTLRPVELVGVESLTDKKTNGHKYKDTKKQMYSQLHTLECKKSWEHTKRVAAGADLPIHRV